MAIISIKTPGWGKLSGDSGLSPTLQEAQVEVYTPYQCARKHGFDYIGEFHICVGKRNKISSCMGDYIYGFVYYCKIFLDRHPNLLIIQLNCEYIF